MLKAIGAVDADLVGAAGKGTKAKPSDLAPEAVFYAEFFPLCHCILAVFKVNNLMRAVVHIKSDGKVYSSAVLKNQAIDQGLIFLMNPAVFKIKRQPVMSLFCQAKNHQAACALIQAVNAWLLDAGGKKISDTRGYAVLLVLAFAFYTEHAAGFVDNNNTTVLIDDIKTYDGRQKRFTPGITGALKALVWQRT